MRRLQQNQQRNRRVALLQRDKTQANNESIKFKILSAFTKKLGTEEAKYE